MVFNMISNFATLALAVRSIMAINDTSGRDVVFYSNANCSGSFKSYRVNLTADPCNGVCMPVSLKNNPDYLSFRITDDHHDSTCYFWDNFDCTGTYASYAQTTKVNGSSNCWVYVHVKDDIPTPIGSVRCYKGSC